MNDEHDYDVDPRVCAAEDALWHAFKGDYDTVLEATEAIHAMAVIAIRALDRATPPVAARCQGCWPGVCPVCNS